MGGGRHKGVVAVPGVGAFAFRLGLIQHDHLRVVAIFRRERRNADLSESTCEGNLVFGGDVLFAKEENVMVDKGGLYFVARVIAQRLAEIDARYFGADTCGDRLNRERSHGVRTFCAGMQ